MRTYTTVERVGERIGDIDWNYDFRQHFNNHCTSDEWRDKLCEESVNMLRAIAELHAAGKKVSATTYGGCPRCGFGEVIDVCMYDGWPYWRPVPSVCIINALGWSEWHSFSLLTDYRVDPD